MAIKAEAELAKKKFLDELGQLTQNEKEEQEKKLEFEDPKIAKFTVSNPIKIQGHIKYTVCGEDGDGSFEEVRRFKEFFALRKAMLDRWPGIYIPAIPEKKLIVISFLIYRTTKITNLLKREELCWRGS
jgi:hypothetical protein